MKNYSGGEARWLQKGGAESIIYGRTLLKRPHPLLGWITALSLKAALMGPMDFVCQDVEKQLAVRVCCQVPV